MSAGPAVVHLRAGGASASISAHGAELTGWTAGGRALIWQPDPAVWNASSPLLFPIVGWARDGKVRVGERVYPMGVHGFAAASHFDAEQVAPDIARFTLSDTPAIFAIYPFRFRLVVTYALSETALRIEIAVANAGNEVMPYACGLHPGFCWPFAGGAQDDYAIVFSEIEDPDVPVIAAGGLFSNERRRTPLDGRRLPLSASLFAQEAMCFLHARSRSVRFEGPGATAISIVAEGFPHFALWSRSGAPFLSIEAWTGHGDPQDFSGDLFAKPSMIHLRPRQEGRHTATFQWDGPAVSG